MTFGHDGSFERATVERLVRACRADWRVDAFRPAEAETDAVYFVTVETPDGRFDPALVHHDYRPGNLLVDPAAGATRAVLDWGNAFASERAYNLRTLI